MDQIKAFFQENDLYAKHSGIELVSVEDGCATAVMNVEAYHLNGTRSVHGGAIFTLADFAFAAACNSSGTVAVALQANISFLQASFEGDTLTAKAKEVSDHPKIRLYKVSVFNRKEELVASFQGTAYRKNGKQIPVK